MDVDAGTAALIGSIFVAVVGVSFGYGILTNRVRTNKDNIDRAGREFRDYKEDVRRRFDEFVQDNKDDHRAIQERLDTIIKHNGGE